MAPTRFASVRTDRSLKHKSSFRDDNSLVAFRYEKTVAAEPPVHMAPRNASSKRKLPQRTPSTSTTTSTSTSVSSSYGPVVVAPPHISVPALVPPTEQHPALRSPLPVLEEWKRDSGHAATTVSSPTIPEEESNEDLGGRNSPSRKLQELDQEGCAPSATSHVEHLDVLGRDSETARDDALNGAPTSDSAADTDTDALPPIYQLPPSTLPPPPPHQSIDSSPSLRRKLSKRASLRLSFWGGHKDQQANRLSAPPPARAPSSSRSRSPDLLRGSLSPASAGIQPPNPPATQTQTSTTMPTPEPTAGEYSPLGIAIPTESLLDDGFMASMNFSNRGSLMFGSEDADKVTGAMNRMSSMTVSDNDRAATPTQASQDSRVTSLDRPQSTATSFNVADTDDEAGSTLSRHVTPRSVVSPTPEIRLKTPDLEHESQKVRLLYESGDSISARHSYCERLEPTPEVPAEEDDHVPYGLHPPLPFLIVVIPPISTRFAAANRNSHCRDNLTRLAPASFVPRSVSSLSQYRETSKKDSELAGGLEDWEDLDGAQIDRYGFITTPRAGSRVGTPTELKSAQYSPRRRNVLQKRDPMGFSSTQGGQRMPSRKVSARSLNTQHSAISATSFRSSRSVIRQAGNLLPHNRNRRWMDEAGDMLTVSPNLQDSVEEAKVEKISEALKRKEWERSEKWRRMAKVVRKGGQSQGQGRGMEFEFDVKNPKLIERTWKGIPDRWRAAAWWSFLAASAKEHRDSPSVDDVVADFNRLQDKNSADDVQIDLDVPRTISRHIMFRRRYRGGQRLLFRVLHALSLYFPETGYVQGMASLAATLLCYFDEESCFVMLVRMWQLRGLERLYLPGFDGLMAALREFETTWLNKDVAKKMVCYSTLWPCRCESIY